MISRKEIYAGSAELPSLVECHLQSLLYSMNVIRKAYGKTMIVTSGLRTQEEHEAIYKKLGKKAPMGSAHLAGLAVDIWDRDSKLWRWCLDNIPLLEQEGLYLEDKSATPTWVHFQKRAPKSGNRIFLP